MIYPIGSTSQSMDVVIVNDQGIPVTGLDHTTFPTVKYSKAGPNADVTITLVALAALTTVWTSGGVKERGEGVYRLDLPDALFSSQAKVLLRGETTDKRLIAHPIDVSKMFSLIEADLYIDTSVTPWAEVHMLKGTGGIGVGTELLRRRLFNTSAANLTSVDTVVGQAKQ